MARITVNDAEQKLVETARGLANLQAKRRSVAETLAALDAEIEGIKANLRQMVPEETRKEETGGTSVG